MVSPGTGLGDRELAIARSVIYASLFDYPLTLAQLRHTLIGHALTPSQILSIYDGSEGLKAIVERRDGLFFPRGRPELVGERRLREARSRTFLRDNRLAIACICAIPYVRMVALSGSIAHFNLDRNGDLDLFIVTREGRAWSVTVAVVLLAKLLGCRRAVCANYTVAESRLAFDQQDLFTASQIVHLKPLVGFDVYRKLLASNPFVYRFYPNFHHSGSGSLTLRRAGAIDTVKSIVEFLFGVPSAAVERICRAAYSRHLRRRAASWQSPEQVRLDPDCLKLHTRSHRQSVLDRFERSVDEAVRRAAAAGGCAVC